ncbi:MAG TPA: hypothetical protein VJ901_09015 [Thermoanaerobaculia bacterium]|nr:hypothetical protein [Thermoanaerobaculia bacterium]
MKRTQWLVISAVLFVAASTLAQMPAAPVAPAAPLGNQPLNRVAKFLAAKYLPSTVLAEAAVNKLNNSRTDQQTSAPSGSAGSTTITDRAGIPDLLALAVERGAITKTTSGSSVTLTTTPYAWLTAFGMRDTAANWKANAGARRVSLASTFASEDVTKGDFSSFASGEVKVVVAGNRSARDFVIANMPGVVGLAQQITDADENQFTNCTAPLGAALGGDLTMKAFVGINDLDPVFANYTPDDATLTVLRQCVSTINLQAAASRAVSANLPKIVESFLKNQNRLQFSIAGLFQRDPVLSDFYTFKLLTDYNPAAGNNATVADTANPSRSANLNAQIDFNRRHTATDGTQLHGIRAWSLEGAANSARFAERRLDGTLAIKATRAKEAGAKTTAIAQARLNIHLNGTMTVPVGLSYARRATDTIKKGFQINVGVSALLDELLSDAGAR